MVEELEVGHELDRALRSVVTGLAQVLERHARRTADRNREAAARTREEWLEQRDIARRRYLPWTRPGAVERGTGADASRAWAAAAAWSTMDPLARETEAELATRIHKTHGEHPSVLVRTTDLTRLPEQLAAAKLLTMPEALELADKHAPYYYARHRDLRPASDMPQNEAETRLHEDWQHFAEHGELPERSRWEAWAEHAGETEHFDVENWRTPEGDVEEASRDSELIRMWDEGAHDRGIRELEEHQVAMAAAGMGDLRSQVTPAETPTWEALLVDARGFENASAKQLATAWRDARAQGATGDLVAQAAAAQLAEQVRKRSGLDPETYLLDTMTERAAEHAEARRSAEDRARAAAEAASRPAAGLLTGLGGTAETITLTGSAASAGRSSTGQAPAAAEMNRERVLELNEQAQRHFAAQLRPGSAGHEYFVDRLGEDVMQGPWALGYAPPGWTRLTDHLRSNGASDEEILGAGLGRVSSRGNVIDAFYNRAMVGIKDTDGRLVGFVGRDLSGDERAPKYTNTGATAAFTKGHHVFGLAEATPGTRLVRTEGPFDAIAVSLAGEGEAAGVAPLGTAITDVQGSLLADRSGGRVWVANDTDEAGQLATENDLFVLARHGVDVRAVDIAGGDPAEAWQRDPIQLRSELAHLDDARPAGDVVLDRVIEAHRAELTEGHPVAQRELEAAAERAAEATPDPVEAQLIRARAEHIAEELAERPDTPAPDAVDVAVTDDQQEVRERSADRDGGGERGVGPEPTQGATDTVGGDVDQPYDRAAESALDDLGEEARNARVASSHGYTQPTGEMVRGTVKQGRSGQPARRNRGPARPGRGRGRGLSR